MRESLNGVPLDPALFPEIFDEASAGKVNTTTRHKRSVDKEKITTTVMPSIVTGIFHQVTK